MCICINWFTADAAVLILTDKAMLGPGHGKWILSLLHMMGVVVWDAVVLEHLQRHTNSHSDFGNCF